MAQTLLRGSTQIMAGTIPASALVSGLALPTSQLQDGALFIKSNGSVAMGASLSMGGFTITNLGTPVNSTDGATKSYVDALANGLTFHNAVRALGASNVTLTGTQTIDGVALNVNDRVLLTNQTTGSQNGFWTVQTSSWVRPADWAAASTQKEGAYVLVDPDGTTYKNSKWYCSSTGTITVDTTATTWAQDTSGTSYANGQGLSLTGTTFAVKLGNGMAFDGSNNVTLSPATGGLLTVSGSGVGITNSTSAAQLIVSNASNQAAWVSSSGDVTVSSAGAFTVNNTAGTGFLKYGNYIANETPGGTINGTNTAFTLANTPQVSSVQLYQNGQLLDAGSGNDYTISGTAITMLFAPLTGDKLRAYYLK
jgi:hypothetical protein